MSKSKGCPFCGATPHHGLGKVQHCQLHGEPFQDFSIWCPHGHAKITARNEERAREQWDTRADELERLSTPTDVADRYFITKGGAYYRPNAEGYTRDPAEAGRFTLDEAISHSHPNGPDGPRDGIDYVLAPKSADVADRREAIARSIARAIRQYVAEQPEDRQAISAVQFISNRDICIAERILALLEAKAVSQDAFDAAADWHDNGGAEQIARGAATRPYAEFRAEVMSKVESLSKEGRKP